MAQSSGIEEWCSLASNKETQACSPSRTSCQASAEKCSHSEVGSLLKMGSEPEWLCLDCLQTVDNWRIDGASCLIPGKLNAYPANYNSNLVCGGDSEVKTTPLIDASGNVYGTIYMFRDYRQRLIATVALNGSQGSQWFLQVPRAGEELDTDALMNDVKAEEEPVDDTV